MAGLPTYQNDNPTLDNVKIDTASPAYQQLASIFGDVANSATNIAVQKNNAMSNSTYLHATAAIEIQKNKADLAIDNDPANAGAYLKDFNDQTNAIVNNAPLNSGDRANLKNSTSVLNSDMATQVGEQQIATNKLAARMSFLTDFPTLLSGIVSKYQTDPQGATNDTNALIDQINNGVKSGYLSGQEGIRLGGMINHVHTRYQEMTNLATYNNGESPSQTFHTYNTGLGQPVQADHPQSVPLVQSSIIANSDTSFKDAVNQYQITHQINSTAYMNFTDAQTNHFNMMVAGDSQGTGFAITHSFPELLQAAQIQSSQPPMTEVDTARAQALQKNINQIKTDPVSWIVNNTPEGIQAKNELIMNNASLQKSTVTPSKQAQQAGQNFNTFLSKIINIAQARGISNNLIKLPADDVQIVTDGFSGDPQKIPNAISIIQSLTPQNAPYAANSLDDPKQKEIALITSHLRGTTNNNQTLSQMFLANSSQGGVNDSVWKKFRGTPAGETDNADSIIQYDLSTKNDSTFNFLSGQPNGPQRIPALMSACVNTIHLMAIQNNDPSLKNLSQYESKIQSVLDTSYHIINLGNASINTTDTGLTQGQLSMIVPQAMKELQDSGNMSPIQREMLNEGDNPFRITIDPGSNIVISDAATGMQLYSQKLTTHWMGLAQHNYKTQNVDNIKQVLGNAIYPSNELQQLEDQ